MNVLRNINQPVKAALMVLLMTIGGTLSAATTDLATTPLITSSGSNVKPNLYYVLDDSGSMDWDYLPDWVNDNYCKTSTTGATSACYANSRKLPVMTSPDVNRIYYNPEITYTPPSNYDGSSKTNYTSWTAVPVDGFGIQSTSSTNLTNSYPDIEWCTDGTYADCVRADNYLLPGTVNGKSYTTQHATTASGTKTVVSGTVTAPTTSTRTLGPFYHLIVPGEYCTTKKLTTCNQQAAPTTTYPYPAKLKWCTSVARDNCQALKNSAFSIPSYPTIVQTAGTSATGKLIVSNTPNNGVTIILGNFVINNGLATQTDLFNGHALSWTSNGNNTNTSKNSLANAIVAQVNAYSNITGFSATSETGTSTGRFKITTPADAAYTGATVRINSVDVTGTTSGTATTVNATGPTKLYLSTAFAGGGATITVPGSWMRVDIVAGSAYGNVVVNGVKIVDRTSRTDCAAPPNCTYSEEMTNFANWYAWYQTRMQLTKSAISRAFSSIDDRFRVGFFTINDNTSKHIINMKKFDATQKQAWYAELFASKPANSTPLREALSKAGRLYGGKTTAISGATDPVEYSCQKNFTILSTDGYWNGNGGVKLDGTTAIGNEDGSLALPEKDGSNTAGTLADVSAYYYNTDLRNSSNCTGVLGVDVCENNVPASLQDKKTTQHMVTYTIGLGIDGVMQYRSNYIATASAADAPDDYEWVAGAKTADQDNGQCSWLSTGTACYWPVPGADKQENMDDLWHAAVNGHGTYYSARNPLELYNGLNDALTGISTLTGGAAAATTSNPNITTGDNFVFSSNYVTGDWTGELVSNTIDITTGDISTVASWSAQAQLANVTAGARTIYTFDGTQSTGMKALLWANLNVGVANTCSPPASEQGCFSSTYIDASLSQFCASGIDCLSSTQKASAQGENLLKFLRGDQTHEQTAPVQQDRWYRTRKFILGDIVSAEAAYVGRYLFDYGTSVGYPEKNTARSNPTVYVAANDGMLHAFNSSSGAERWAYVPSMAMKNMFKIADIHYNAKHIYLVDGTPVVGDVQDGGAWKTLLIGGLGGGGAGYYALDITDQTTPKAKWELRQMSGCTAGTVTRTTSSGGVTYDCDLGYSFGNPVIGKLSSGTWVVIVTSGYNNDTGGIGQGYLYVLNAMTGVLISKVSTGVGSATTPSGLGRINAWSENAMQDGTINAVYGGDLLGNMWKFDFGSGSTPTVSKLYAAGSTKPITAKPELGKVITISGQTKRVVFFPTGRLLGTVDLGDTNTQTFYAIWDKASGVVPTTLVQSSVSTSGNEKIGQVADSVFEDDNNLGWYLDFSEPGERGNTDPTLAFGTLVFSTNKPTAVDVCNATGFVSWVYNLDYLSGGVVKLQGNVNAHAATQYPGASTRPTVIVLPSGVVKSITRTAGNAVTNNVEDVRIKSSAASGRRISWRELMN